MTAAEIISLTNKYGFPIVFSICLGGLIYYIWNWVTRDIKPVISEANSKLVRLIDRIRVLDNDMIRLKQKIETYSQLRSRLDSSTKK